MGHSQSGCTECVCSSAASIEANMEAIIEPSQLLESLSGTVSLFHTLCNRSLNFLRKCLNSNNALVSFVSCHAVYYSGVCSCMGHNVQFYCRRFGKHF